MIFAERLRELRTTAGLTQKDLAKQCEVAQSCIAMLEKGRSEANISTLIALSKFFNVSIEYLVGIENDFGISTIAPSSTYSATEQKIISDFRALNPACQKLVQDTIKTLLTSSGAAHGNNKNIS